MSKRWQQWMPFHIDAFKSSPSVRAMHPAARSGYLYLLAYAWQTEDCTIPTDVLELAEISELGDELWATHGPRILRKFLMVDGKWRNEKLFEEWKDAKRVFDARSASGHRTNQQRSPNGQQAVTGTQGQEQEHRQEQKQKTKAVAQSEIERVYAMYPRKVGRGAGIKAIKQAVRRIAPDRDVGWLLGKVRIYAQSCDGMEERFIPHPATWFNQERYEDENDGTRQNQKRNQGNGDDAGGEDGLDLYSALYGTAQPGK